MEQKDYLMREVEKIGLIMSAIGQKIFGGKGNTAITLEEQIKDAKDMLFNGADFDMDKFLNSTVQDSNKYISGFIGFNNDNIELLANYLFQIGLSNKSDNSKKYLEKALQLFELCNLQDKTYSFERESNIKIIKIKLTYLVKV
jgi:hypothetical protein